MMCDSTLENDENRQNRVSMDICVCVPVFDSFHVSFTYEIMKKRAAPPARSRGPRAAAARKNNLKNLLKIHKNVQAVVMALEFVTL